MRRKHSIDFKISVIQEYLNGDLGYRLLSAKHKIDTKLLRTWANQFKQNGVQGLTAGMKKSTYSDEFKLNVLQYCLEHQLSYRETANAFDIPNASVIAQWQSQYNQYGILGLEIKSKGRLSEMDKKSSKQKQNNPESLNETEREELERLRVEKRKLEVTIALEKSYNY